MIDQIDSVMEEIIWMGAAELAGRLRSGELSSEEVVEAYIQRNEQVNSQINALVFPCFEQAREEARRADQKRRSGEQLSPLHGVPMSFKDQFLVTDTPCTFGVANKKDHRAERDGPLVKRLRDAGVIPLGKTNVPQLMAYIESENPLYGRTINPWNPERTSGGSTGGEAALIAAGGSPLGLGSDIGGSIREPCHFCGIAGLKPTSWRLSNMDTPPWLGLGQENLVPATGPMARRVEDLDLAMRILAAPGQEKFDPSIPPVPWPDYRQVDVSRLRIAVVTDDGYFPASPALRRAVREAGEALRLAGAQVEEWTPPDVLEAMQLFFALMSADGAAAFRGLLEGDKALPQLSGLLMLGRLPRFLHPFVRFIFDLSGQKRLARLLQHAGKISAREYYKVVEQRTFYHRRFLAELDEGGFDAILSPPAALPALLHGSTKTLVDFDSYARVYNVLGWPAGVVPATRIRPGEVSDRPDSRDPIEREAKRVEEGSAGLPVGVQVAARPWREDIVLAVMSSLEGHFSRQLDYPHQPAL